MGGALLRSALQPAEARWLCREMTRLSRTRAGGPLLAAGGGLGNRPREMLSWCHPFSRLSSCGERPTRLLRWSEELLHALAPGAAAAGVRVDSLLVQVYAAGGSLLPHTDADLSWGLGVSLGAEAVFECLPRGDGAVPQTIRLRSGDIVAGEWGALRHAVRVPRAAAAPEWWDGEAFGCAAVRCSLLARQALTAEEQRALGEGRARRLYGIGLEELARRTGEEVPSLCLRLRHEAAE